MSPPSMTPLTAGTCCSADTAPLTKADMKPSFTPCFSRKASLYSLRRPMMPDMSTSLNVVSIAYVFCAPFSLRGVRGRRGGA